MTRIEIQERAEPVRGRAFAGWRIELLPSQPYEARYVAPTDSVGFAFDPQRGVHAFGSDRPVPFATRPNSVAWVPAGCDVMSRSERGGEYLVLRLSEPLATGRAERFSDRMDAPAITAAHTLRARLLAGDLDLLEAEGLVEILRRAACRLLGVPDAPSGAERWMTSCRLRTIIDLVESRLDQPLTVEELAGALGLSTAFFIRAFRAAVGRGPHGYVVDRRLARARLRMVGTHASLTDIALDCGFSSHAHMTATFRQRLGTTPGRIRRGL